MTCYDEECPVSDIIHLLHLARDELVERVLLRLGDELCADRLPGLENAPAGVAGGVTSGLQQVALHQHGETTAALPIEELQPQLPGATRPGGKGLTAPQKGVAGQPHQRHPKLQALNGAAEAAVGLAIILTVFKNRQTLEIDELDSLKN